MVRHEPCAGTRASRLYKSQNSRPLQEWTPRFLSFKCHWTGSHDNDIVVDTLRVAHVLLCRVPPCCKHFTTMVPLEGYPESPTLLSTSLQRVRWVCYGNVCSIASILVSGHRPVTAPITSCAGCGVCTRNPNGAESERLWTVQHVDARLVTSSSGRTSRPGDPRPNPQGSGTDRPCCLLSTA